MPHQTGAAADGPVPELLAHAGKAEIEFARLVLVEYAQDRRGAVQFDYFG